MLPNRYSELVDESVNAAEGAVAMRHVVAGETITPALAMSDTMILGLRLIDGVSFEAFRERHGREIDVEFGELLREFEGYGIVERTATHVRLTRRGRLLSNELFQRLLPQPAA